MMKAKLADLPDDALLAIDNHGECRFIQDGDIEVEKNTYICIEDERVPGENDPNDESTFFPCVVRLTSWA